MADKKTVKPKSPDTGKSKADTGRTAERKSAKVTRHRKSARVSHR